MGTKSFSSILDLLIYSASGSIARVTVSQVMPWEFVVYVLNLRELQSSFLFTPISGFCDKCDKQDKAINKIHKPYIVLDIFMLKNKIYNVGTETILG